MLGYSPIILSHSRYLLSYMLDIVTPSFSLQILLYCNLSLFPLYFIILYLHGYLYSALTLLHLVCNQHDNILNLTPGFLFICFYLMTSRLLYLQPFRT